MKVQVTEATPYKVDSDEPERTYAVQENGDVVMTEIITNIVTFTGREFTTWVRSFEANLTNVNYDLSDHNREELTKAKDSLLTRIEPLRELREKSEEQVQKDYNKKKWEGIHAAILQQITDEKVREPESVKKVWANLTDEGRKYIEDKLSEAETVVFKQILDSAKTQE